MCIYLINPHVGQQSLGCNLVCNYCCVGASVPQACRGTAFSHSIRFCVQHNPDILCFVRSLCIVYFSKSTG